MTILTHYLNNGWKWRLGCNGAPMGNDYLGIKWSCDRWRHVTLKGQGRDPNMLRANISKTARYSRWVPMDHQ